MTLESICQRRQTTLGRSLGVWLWPILMKMEDEWFKKAVLDAVIKSVSDSLLVTHAADVEACRSLV
ncbi:BnaA01g06390D [Brassica napus]|uniref:BnaA01g06390D protein n=1 Tax=Brassica napus TaxID=3708 RepID=A0A078GNU2_BRANA|nr:BnaA01g06390D [Brassica napus]